MSTLLLYPDSESIQMFNKYLKTVSKKSKSCVSFLILFPLLHTRAASSSDKYSLGFYHNTHSST